MKRKLLILGLAVVFLFGAQNVFAATQVTVNPASPIVAIATNTVSANATTTNCFDYYKFGSVQVHIDPIVSHVAPGGVVQFKGSVVNANSYPIVDGSVYIKIFRNDAKNNRMNGFPVVDQFIAKDNISLAANGTSSLEFNWIVPLNAMSGDYQAGTFFQSADEFSLLGLTFTNDIVGNKSDFKIDGTADANVILSKDDVTVAGQHFMFAAYPPVVSATGTIVINTVLVNTTNQTQSIPVTWSIYKWDGLKKENLIGQKVEMYTAKSGQTKVSFSVTDTTYPVYYVVAEANYKDSKSILDIRFVRDTKTNASLMLPAVTSYPLKAGVSNTLFSCFWATSIGGVYGGKLELSIVDPSGKSVESLQYTGVILSNMMALKKDFIPVKDLTNFTIKANLYQDGVLKDSASMVYDCKKIDPSLCPVAAVPAQSNLLWWVIGALIGLVIIGLVTVLGKKKAPMAMLFIIFAVGFAHAAEAKSVQWVGDNTMPMFAKSVDGFTCLLFNGYNQSSVPTCNNSIATKSAAGIPVAPSSLHITVDYAAGIMNMDTGQSIPETSPLTVVSPGTRVRLEFSPLEDYDITWVGTGAYMGSPYAYWTDHAIPPDVVPLPPADDTGVDGYDDVIGHYRLYMAMAVSSPWESISNLTGLDCSDQNISTWPSKGQYVYRDCTVTALPGSTISPSFNFQGTSALFYQENSKQVANNKTYSQINKLIQSGNGTDAYQQSIPRQSIPISFSVQDLPVPITSSGTCDSSGTPGAVSWTAPATPPANYTLKVYDVTSGAPGTLAVNNTVTTTSYTFATIAGRSYTYDLYAGANTQSSSHSSFTCASPNPAPTVHLYAYPQTVASGSQPSTLTWTSTDATSCSASASPDSSQWTGSRQLNSTTGASVYLSTPTTYIITCNGPGGSDSASVPVAVTPVGQCSNGANNPAACNTCTSPLVWNESACMAPTCTSFAYGDWGVCTSGTQTRSYTGTPPGCTGGTPVITQSCSASNSNCFSQVSVAGGGFTDKTFANVGQLVKWTAVGAGPYSWTGNGVVGLPKGSTYQVRYSTIGNKTVYLNGIACKIGLNGQQAPLPVISDPNFRSF